MLLIERTIIPMLAEEAGTDAAAGIEVVRAMLIVLGIVIIAVMLVLSTRGKIARRQADRPTPREQIEQAKAGHGARRDSSLHARPGRASASVVDEAQHLTALLDNKAERLEQLLAEADETILRLERVLHTDSAHAEQNHHASFDDNSARQEQPADAAADLPADPLTRSVYELADAGHDSVEIAQQLDEQVGKIDLILALRQ